MAKRKSVLLFPIKVNNIEIADSLLIAEKFNDKFADIGPNLISKIPQAIIHQLQYNNATSPLLNNRNL